MSEWHRPNELKKKLVCSIVKTGNRSSAYKNPSIRWVSYLHVSRIFDARVDNFLSLSFGFGTLFGRVCVCECHSLHFTWIKCYYSFICQLLYPITLKNSFIYATIFLFSAEEIAFYYCRTTFRLLSYAVCHLGLLFLCMRYGKYRHRWCAVITSKHDTKR